MNDVNKTEQDFFLHGLSSQPSKAGFLITKWKDWVILEKKLKCLLLMADLVASVAASTNEEAAKTFPLISEKLFCLRDEEI